MKTGNPFWTKRSITKSLLDDCSDHALYFRVESYRCRGKGTRWRVIRLRDNLVINELIKHQVTAEETVKRMLPDERRIVSDGIEKAILG